MNKLILLRRFTWLVSLILGLSFVGVAKADIAPPSYQTTFYFQQQNGQPINQPVKFTIKCYGTGVFDESNKVFEISDFSRTRQSYGAAFDTSNLFETYRKNTEYCDIVGEVDGKKFETKKFVGTDLSGLSCENADFQMYNGTGYYKYTPQYQSCKDAVYAEYMPANGGFICDKYMTPVPSNECLPQAGYKTVNGQCLKETNESWSCISEMNTKEKACNQYLEDVTTMLIKDADGHPYEKLCKATIKVPFTVANISPTKPQDTPLATTSISTGTQQSPDIAIITEKTTEKPKGFFARLFGSIGCFFKKLFGKSC